MGAAVSATVLRVRRKVMLRRSRIAARCRRPHRSEFVLFFFFFRFVEGRVRNEDVIDVTVTGSLPWIRLMRPVHVVQVSAGLLATGRRTAVRIIWRVRSVVATRTPRCGGVPLRGRVIAVARRRETVFGISALRSPLRWRRRVHHLIKKRQELIQSERSERTQSKTYRMK